MGFIALAISIGRHCLRYVFWYSAMVVRFITRRFIGEYDPNLEKVYSFNTIMDNEAVLFEILDAKSGQLNVRITSKQSLFTHFHHFYARSPFIYFFTLFRCSRVFVLRKNK